MKSSKSSDKIKTLNNLADIIEVLRRGGNTIVLCHGVFDLLLHPGHIKHLEAAKCEGDILIVTITQDKYVNKGIGRPVFNQRLRAESIAALQCVDYVGINKWATAVEAIKKLKPDVYAKGSDYAHREDDLTAQIYKEEEAIKSIGGRIHFTDEITFSTTGLLNTHFDFYPEEAHRFLEKFRSNYSSEDIIKRLNNLKKMTVLVIGDTIIDEYHYCNTLGKLSKDNVITTRYLREETFAGGVLATANHIAGFCQDVHLVTCLGTQDNYEKFILSHLKPNIKPKFFYRDNAPTIVKRRFVEPDFLSKMFEICYLDDIELPKSLNQEICNYLQASTSKYDLVLVSDFGHGFIGQKLIHVLCDKAKFLAVNTQTNSDNAGFNLITKYPRADYICIDEGEIRLACCDKFGNLEDLTMRIAKDLQCNRIAITRGHCGSLTYADEVGFFEIPVLSEEVVDRVGAGDAYLSITSPCVAAGNSMEMVGFIGNAVGALKVRIVCNRTSVEPIPLFKFITALLK